MSAAAASVLFCAAAGPRVGFGHLVRGAVLARALNVVPRVVLRGSADAARAAVAMGWAVERLSSVLTPTHEPALMIVDDPCAHHAARWIQRARHRGIPVAVVRDLGLLNLRADLTIDGSITMRPGSAPADLQGPDFAILDPSLADLRASAPRREPFRIVVALGGGAHVRAMGVELADAIMRRVPQAVVEVAPGFVAGRLPALGQHGRWIPAGRLHTSLATASVAVVAGGLTLYEACALASPVVAVAVAPAQRLTTRAFADAGAIVDASAPSRARTISRTVAAVARLVTAPAEAAALGRAAGAIVDGRGAARVADRLRQLGAGRRAGGRDHAA
jgi:spore coat polysaccharide biosynthesis predicted glycosyltransferase SpsG